MFLLYFYKFIFSTPKCLQVSSSGCVQQQQLAEATALDHIPAATTGKDQLASISQDQLSSTSQEQLSSTSKDQLAVILQDQLTSTISQEQLASSVGDQLFFEFHNKLSSESPPDVLSPGMEGRKNSYEVVSR